jgi:hypothetical protein
MICQSSVIVFPFSNLNSFVFLFPSFLPGAWFYASQVDRVHICNLLCNLMDFVFSFYLYMVLKILLYDLWWKHLVRCRVLSHDDNWHSK